MRWTVIPAVAFLGLTALAPALPAAAQDDEPTVSLELQGRVWRADLDGTITSAGEALAGTRIRLRDDLAVEDRETVPEGRLSLAVGRHRVRVGAFRTVFEGDTTLERSLAFAGVSFVAGERASTRLEATVAEAGYQFELFRGEWGHLAVGVEGRGIRTEARVESATKRATETAQAVIPAAAASLRLRPFSWLALAAEVRGVALGGLGRFVDGEGVVEWQPIRFLGFRAGYRVLDFRVDEGDTEVDVTLRGPFAVVFLRF